MLIIQFFFRLLPRPFVCTQAIFLYRVSVHSRQKTEVNEYCNSIDFCFTKSTQITALENIFAILDPNGSLSWYTLFFFFFIRTRTTLCFGLSILQYLCTTWNYYETEQVYALSIALYYS